MDRNLYEEYERFYWNNDFQPTYKQWLELSLKRERRAVKRWQAIVNRLDNEMSELKSRLEHSGTNEWE